MGFLSRITKAVTTIATAIYETSVQVYRDLVGKPEDEQQRIVEDRMPFGYMEDVFEPEEPEFIPGVEDEVELEEDNIFNHNEGFVRDIIRDVNNLSPLDKKLLRIVFDDNGVEKVKYYTLNIRGKRKILTYLREYLSGSDSDESTERYNPLVDIEIKRIISYDIMDVGDLTGGSLNGGLFVYKHLIDNGFVKDVLRGLDIYHIDDPIDVSDNCFVKSCEDVLTESELLMLKKDVRGSHIKVVQLKEMSQKLDLYIDIYKIRANGEVRHIRYNEKGTRRLNVCLIEDHFFKYIEDTGITSYYLKNMEELNEISDPHRVYSYKDGRVKRISDKSDRKGISSYHLVKYLVENKTLLKPIEDIEKIEWVSEKFSGEYRPYLEPEKFTRPLEVEKQPSIEFDHWMTYDTETYNTPEKITHPYLVCTSDTDEIFYSINFFCKYLVGKYGVKYGKDNKPKTLLLYAHNSTFDNVHMLGKLLNQKVCIKDGKHVYVKGLLCRDGKKVEIIIKDSYRLINSPLRDFGKMFELNVKKEVMYYDMFNYNTISRGSKYKGKLPCDLVQSYIYNYNKTSLDSDKVKLEKQQIFWDNVLEWDCLLEDGRVDIMKYSAKYCLLDCEVLKKGLEKFGTLMKEVNPKIDFHNYYSQSSIADWNLRLNGCYDGVVEMNGVFGDYFQDAVVGGRCMLKKNKKVYCKDKKYSDFDCNSLYPSAMIRCGGFPIGSPEIIEDKNYHKIKNYDYYVVTIKVTKVGRKLNFPLMSYKTQDGRLWTDDLNSKKDNNGILRVDKVTLEDLIKFQKIEFEILDGWYFKEGLNNKICEVVKKLFDWRQSVKKSNPPLANILKLLMNSSYGKTIQRPVEVDNIIVPEDSFVGYIKSNYNFIKTFTPAVEGGYYLVELMKSVVSSWGRPHIGGLILSTSKRIMNEVMTLADDKIYYTDTDSIHIEDDCLEQLEKDFEKEYGRKLCGKSYGQFHSDFGWGNSEDDIDESTIRSIKFIGVGKKVYYDKLIGKDNVTGEWKESEHFRMKGVPSYVVRERAKELGISLEQLYEYHLERYQVEYDLNVGGRIRFDYNKNQSYIANDGKFTRRLKFLEDGESENVEDVGIKFLYE